MATTAMERMIASLMGGDTPATIASLNQAVTAGEAESAATTLTEEAVVWRILRDARGNPVTETVDEEARPVQQIVYQGPAKIVKPKTPRYISLGGGREDIADWEGHTLLDYNSEAADEFECAGFRYHVKGSNEGETGAAVRRVFLQRTGRFNRGI